MKGKAYIGLWYALICIFVYQNVKAQNALNVIDITGQNKLASAHLNTPPIATNDTIIHINNCIREITGNLFSNDFDPDGDNFRLYFAVTPLIGKFTITSEGDFLLQLPIDFYGDIAFDYYIIEETENEYKGRASVFIKIIPDCDCDQVSDSIDLDFDNDGITNSDEGDGFIDTDNDLIPDCYDIDSDNDGITDNIEWQSEFNYIPPSNKDTNKNGWDDAYDSFITGFPNVAEDTNKDGIPDMLDPDSDNDGISDFIEAFDSNNDGKTEMRLSYTDSDSDGLDDAFDTVNCWSDECNPIGSKSPLPDWNKNGIRDWRDKTEKLPISSYLIYPNPVKNSFKIAQSKIPGNATVDIKIYTISGQLVLQKEIYNLLQAIDVSALNPGTYLISVVSNDFSAKQKIIIN
ncbi:T9SS type A sorting domain-containing protein [uncultured Draconibacterium sp.]|uniref:T9SS type A sorting domain-containing protein n=1 Tax=uncultured Draconibacterium sp. TaxID=1573823 RepID=UPI003216955F